jgi:uncharacterized protein (DUF362 family)
MKKNRHCTHDREADPNQGKDVTRRDFLGALGASTAAVLLGSCAKAPSPLSPVAAAAGRTSGAAAVSRGMSSVLAGSSRVAKATVASYDFTLLRRNIESMFDAIGGIGDVVGGKTVGLKINLTGGSGSANTNPPPVEYYWTHPDVVRAAGELIKDAGARKLVFLEAVYDAQSYTGPGFKDVQDHLGADFIDLNGTAPYSSRIDRPVGDGWLIYEKFTQNAALNDMECMVSFPKAKTHVGAGFTNAMKMLVGSVPLGIYGGGQSYRSELHSHREIDNNPNSNLRRIVIDLNRATPLHLTVTDIIKTMKGGEGPWIRGVSPVTFNTLLASKDVVAADSVAAQVIGFDPMTADDTGVFKDGINYLRLAQEMGMGTYDLSMIEVVDATVSTGIRQRQPLS